MNQLIKEKRIGILAMQETHLNEARKSEIEDLFKKRLVILNIEDPNNPMAKGEVTFVLNKNLLDTADTKFVEVVKGRAALLQAHWHKDQKITIIVGYALNITPTNAIENVESWKKMITFLDARPTLRVDTMLGDFNMVKEMINRRPMRHDSENAQLFLSIIKEKLRLSDGWQDTCPDTKAFTFFQSATAMQSCLDRIYTSARIEKTAREWLIEPSGIPGTDHDLVSVRVMHEKALIIGKGRWSTCT